MRRSTLAHKHTAVVADVCIAVADLAISLRGTALGRLSELETGMGLCLTVVDGEGKFLSDVACYGVLALLEVGLTLSSKQWVHLAASLVSPLKKIKWDLETNNPTVLLSYQDC